MGRPKTKITENQRRSIVSGYQKGQGFVALAEKIGKSIPVIRRILVENGVKIRGKGRPVTA